MNMILKYEFRRENSLELGVRFGHLTVWIELFELRTLKFNDQSDNNHVMLLKIPELEVDILSVDIQCGTPVRYPDFNNYTEVLIQMKWMVWRTNWIAGAGTGDRIELWRLREVDGLSETSLVAKTGAVPDFCWVAPWERLSPHRWWLYFNSLWMWSLYGTILIFGRKTPCETWNVEFHAKGGWDRAM